MSTEQQFDDPIDVVKLQNLGKRLQSQGWGLSEERWNEIQSIEFYKGMYAMIRVASSLTKDEKQRDQLSHIGLDLTYLITPKS